MASVELSSADPSIQLQALKPYHSLASARTLSAEQSQILRSLFSAHLSEFVGCLSSPNTEVADFAIDVMKATLNHSAIALRILQDPSVHQLLVSSTAHPNARLRYVLMSGLVPLASTEEGVRSLFETSNIAVVVAMLTDPDIGVAQKAKEVIVKVMQNRASHRLFNERGEVLQKLREFIGLDESGEFTMRVMECFADTAAASVDAEGFRFVEGSGMLDAIVNGVCSVTDDILMLLNYLVLLEKVTEGAQGIEFIEQRPRMFPRLVQLIGHPDPSIASFAVRYAAAFGKQSERACEVAIQRGWFGQMVARLCARDTPSDLMDSILTGIGAMGKTAVGLSFLMADAEASVKFGNQLLASDPNIRAACLHGLGLLFSAPSNSEALQLFFNRLFQSDPQSAPPNSSKVSSISPQQRFQALLDQRRQHNPDVRMAAFHCLRSLASHRWGAVHLATLPGFVDWLSNRRIEQVKEGMEWKFGIAQQLFAHIHDIVASCGANQTMANDLARTLRDYVQAGPFAPAERVTAVMNPEIGEPE